MVRRGDTRNVPRVHQSNYTAKVLTVNDQSTFEHKHPKGVFSFVRIDLEWILVPLGRRSISTIEIKQGLRAGD
jgi:hypothetical protein